MVPKNLKQLWEENGNLPFKARKVLQAVAKSRTPIGTEVKVIFVEGTAAYTSEKAPTTKGLEAISISTKYAVWEKI